MARRFTMFTSRGFFALLFRMMGRVTGELASKTFEALGEGPIVRIAQCELEVRDVAHEGAPEHEVPFVQLEREFNVAAAKVEIRGKP